MAIILVIFFPDGKKNVVAITEGSRSEYSIIKGYGVVPIAQVKVAHEGMDKGHRKMCGMANALPS